MKIENKTQTEKVTVPTTNQKRGCANSTALYTQRIERRYE
jgi:hypothetical protein